MLDGRIWMEMVRVGKARQYEQDAEDLEETRNALRDLAKRKGWM